MRVRHLGGGRIDFFEREPDNGGWGWIFAIAGVVVLLIIIF